MAGIKSGREVAMGPGNDQIGMEGHAVNVNGDPIGGSGENVYGVIADGAPAGSSSTVIPLFGGPSEVIKVKLSATPGTINRGTRLMLDQTELSTFTADTETGARVVVGEAWEDGAAGELVGALLFTPEIFTA